MIKWEKISLEQYINDFGNDDGYNDLKLPERKTKFSSGYDFYCPRDLIVRAYSSLLIPTGIKVMMDDNMFLALYIRSSMAIKNNLRLVNQVGIIDCDYYNNSDNEGHIMVCLYNDSDEDIKLKKNERIVQGIFQKFYLTDNDNVSNIRMGGIGSTNQRGDDNYE